MSVAIIQDNCTIIICKCGYTNHEHRTGICPDGLYWFENIDSAEERETYDLSQAPGGDYWIPLCEHIDHEFEEINNDQIEIIEPMG